MAHSRKKQPQFSRDDEREPARGSRLCRICAAINFHKYLESSIDEPIDLGYWESIRRSVQCPFCRLVVHCVESNSLHDVPPATTVILNNELSWKLGIQHSPYDSSKSDSYSNKYDLRSLAAKSFFDAYRFTLSVTSGRSQSSPDHIGVIQYLAHKENTSRDQQLYGRLVRPEQVDLDLLRSWLRTCLRNHGEECAGDAADEDTSRCSSTSFDSGTTQFSIKKSGRSLLPNNLRLINVNCRTIVRALDVDVPEYVALSYVWGKDAMKRETGLSPVVLTREMMRWKEQKECTPLPEKIPKTIEDAMTVTHLLGFTYLWVDAFCIVQNVSLAQKIPHLSNMKDIYSHSTLTIAAAAGHHVHHGLPGVGVPRSTIQCSEVVQGLRLAAMLPSFSAVESSSELVYNTRGWTFQEKLLSRRLLLFTDYQVYYKCSEAIWSEEIMLENEKVSKSVEARLGKFRWLQSHRRATYEGTQQELLAHFTPQLKINDEWGYLRGYLDYTAAIQEYTRRTLSDAADTEFAISGVLETMEGIYSKFILGLPEQNILESLMWHPKIGSVPVAHHYGDLPSWTWSAYTFDGRGIFFDLMDTRQIRAALTAIRRGWSAQQQRHQANEARVAEGRRRVTETRNYAALSGMMYNLVSCLSWPLMLKHLTIRKLFYCYDKSKRPLDFQRPIRAIDHPPLVALDERYTRSGTESWAPPKCLLPRHKHALAFQAVTVRFYIGKAVYERCTENKAEVGLFELLNSKDECVGEVVTTYERAYRSSGRSEFVTISWGLSLKHVNLHRKYVPRWTFDSQAKEGSLRAFLTGGTNGEVALAELAGLEIGLAPSVNLMMEKYGQYLPKSLLLKLDSARKPDGAGSKLCTEIYAAKKGERRPRSLWTVAHLIMVDRDGNLARRAGVAKVILGAWRDHWTVPQEVILA